MIVRGGRRTVTDMGPSPAHVDSHYSFNTNAVASEPFVAPVERRFLNPIELARIHEQEPVPYLPVVTVAERAAAVIVARSRGGQATKRNRSEQAAMASAARWQRQARHPLPVVWETLRNTRGVMQAAAFALGQDHSTLRSRVMRNLDEAPPDVRALVLSPIYVGKWAKRRAA